MLRLKPVAACCSDSFSWNEQGNSRWVGAEQLGGNAINTLPQGTGGGGDSDGEGAGEDDYGSQ